MNLQTTMENMIGNINCLNLKDRTLKTFIKINKEWNNSAFEDWKKIDQDESKVTKIISEMINSSQITEQRIKAGFIVINCIILRKLFHSNQREVEFDHSLKSTQISK